MPHITCDTITPDEIAELLRDAGAPEPEDSAKAHEQLASILNLMMQYPIKEQPEKPNPEAVRLNFAIASLRRTLPGYIKFWEIAENPPNLPEDIRQKIKNLRAFETLLDVTFPKGLRTSTKVKSCWREVGADLFEFRAQTPWHERALYLSAWYQNHVKKDCGTSRGSAATRFIQAVLKRSKVGHFTLDAIEKALARARQAPYRKRGLAD